MLVLTLIFPTAHLSRSSNPMDPSHRSRFPLILVSDAHFTREHVYSMLHTTSKTSTNEAPFILISDLLLDEIKKPPPPTLSPSR